MTRASHLLVVTALVCTPGVVRAQQDAFSLEGLVITASPTPRSADAVASYVTILSGDDLRARGTRTVGEALRDVAGIHVARNGSFGAVTSVFLRGGESDYTLVLVDGVQVNLAGGGFDFASLTTANVERVEIVRGPASALYGSDAVTGVINVVTRTGRGAPRVSFGMETGSFGRRDWVADFLAGTDRAGYSLSVARRSTNGLLAFNNGHVSTVVSGRARLLPDDLTEVGVTVRVTDQQYRFPTDGSGAVVDRNAFTFSDAIAARVTVRRVLSDRLSVEALIGLNETDGGTDDAQDGPADTLGFYGFTSLDDFRRVSGEVRAHVLLGRAVLTGGLEVEEESQRSFTESVSEFGPSNGRSDSRRRNRGLFVHAAGDVGRLALSGGGRLEANSRFGRIGTWQAGLSWLVPGGTMTRVRASIGRAIKEPTFFENFATGFAVGNPDLEPERSISWEVGVEQTFLDELVSARATFFDQRFRDLIQFTFTPPTPSDPNYFNVAEASSRGVELDVSVEASGFGAGLSRTWLDTEVIDSGFDDGPGATFVEGEPLLRRPADRWAIHASGLLGARGRVFGRFAVVGSRSDRNFSTFPATPVDLAQYELLSIGAQWTVIVAGAGVPALSLTLRADNVLDEDYVEVLGFRAPGRGVYVGASVAIGGGR